MEEKNKPTTSVPCIPMTIGRTRYLVNVHFSETASETMEEKLIRIIKTEVEGHLST